MAKKYKYYCTSCGELSNGKVKGSLFITLLLLCCVIIPGIIYEVWRGTGAKLCKGCNAQTLIPAKSPRAIQLQKQAEKLLQDAA
jgi:hypothetical protein